MAENIIITLVERVESLTNQIQKIETQVSKPAIVNTDVVKLAKELGSQMDSRVVANEEVARRIEAAVDRIPASVSVVSEKVIVVEWRTAYWIAFVAAMVAATAVYFVVVANPAVARYLDDKNVETRAHLEYHIERNPKTELGYYTRE
jgi:hypothetical protein